MRKCAILLSKLSEAERHQFQQWLVVERNGRQAPIQDLLDCYLDGHEEEALWRKICPNQAFDSQELGRKFGQLMIHLEEFLAIQAFRKDRMLRDRMLLKRLNEMRIGREFLKYINKVRRRLDKSGRRDKWYFEHLFALEGELLQHQLIEKIPKHKRRYAERRDTFLTWLCQVFMDQQVLQLARGEKQKDNLLVNWEEQLTELISTYAQLKDEPILSLLFKYKHLQEGKDIDLDQLFEQFSAHQHRLSSDMRYNLIIILYNHINRKQLITKEDRYFFLRLEVEQIGIKEGWMIIGNYLQGTVYKNHISLRNSCMYLLSPTKRQAWMSKTFELLESFKPMLAPREQEEVYYYNLLQCQFFSGQSQLLLKRRQIAPFSDPHNEGDFRILQLLARFEQKDHYLIESMIKSTRQYIRTQPKIRDTRKRTMLEELKFVHQLFKASSQKDWQKLKKGTQSVLRKATHSWLLVEIDKHL